MLQRGRHGEAYRHRYYVIVMYAFVIWVHTVFFFSISIVQNIYYNILWKLLSCRLSIFPRNKYVTELKNNNCAKISIWIICGSHFRRCQMLPCEIFELRNHRYQKKKTKLAQKIRLRACHLVQGTIQLTQRAANPNNERANSWSLWNYTIYIIIHRNLFDAIKIRVRTI